MKVEDEKGQLMVLQSLVGCQKDN